jgi:Protein of unknown function (DUF732)
MTALQVEMKPLLAVALMALTLGSGATLAEVEARADDGQLGGGVGAYLNHLEDSGFSGDDSARLVKLGDETCYFMRTGATWTSVVQGLVTAGLPGGEARILSVQAMMDLCPDALPPSMAPTTGGGR